MPPANIVRLNVHRILDFATEPARLRVKHKQLIVERGSDTCSIPLSEASVVIVSQGQVTFSNSVLTGILEAGGMLVICNRNFLPVGMLLPLTANHVQVERFANQKNATQPANKRIWQQLVRAKIKHQAAALRFLHGDSSGLEKLASEVKSGDPHNVVSERRFLPNHSILSSAERASSIVSERRFLPNHRLYVPLVRDQKIVSERRSELAPCLPMRPVPRVTNMNCSYCSILKNSST